MLMQSSIDQKQGTLLVTELSEMISLSTDIETQLFSQTFEMMLEEPRTYDCLTFFSSKQSQKPDNQQEGLQMKTNFEKLHSLLKMVKEHDFNKTNFSNDIYKETRIHLIQKIQNEANITKFLKFLVHITAVDESFIQSGSNALNILVEMKADLKKQQWQNIKIKNTSIVGANLAKCNLSYSEFENVDMNGVNLNGALLFNCKWINIKVDELHVLNGHYDLINSISFSPNGKLLASGSSDFSICIWDLITGKIYKKMLLNYYFWVQSVCFSPNGSTLASGQKDGFVNLWDVKSCKRIFQFHDHRNLVSQVRFSPDGYTLASCSYDCTINLWDIRIGKLTFKLNEHKGRVCSISFSQDNTTLASCGSDESIILWDYKVGKLKLQLNEHQYCVKSVCFSPDGTTLASFDSDAKIYLWDVKTGKPIKSFQYCSGLGESKSVCFSLDGEKLITSSSKNTNFIDIKTGKKKSLDKRGSHQACFSPDGTIFAYCNSSIYLENLNFKDQNDQQNHIGSAMEVCFSSDGTTLASYSSDNFINLWDPRTGKQKLQIKYKSSVTSICFSPDGSILASGSDDKSICLWTRIGKLKQQLSQKCGRIRSIDFSPNGCILVSASNNKQIFFWNTKTGKIARRLKNFESLHSVCFSPEGTILAQCPSNDSLIIILRDTMTGEPIQQLNGHRKDVNDISFSPDGLTLASVGRDKSICLWDVKSGDLKQQIDYHTSSVNSVSFSPDGTILASAGDDNLIFLLNANTGEILQKLHGHSRSVRKVCFSPDGTYLASCSFDITFRLWELNTEELIQQLEDYPELTFSENCELLKADKEFNIENILSKVQPIVTTICISSKVVFQSNGAIVFQGVFQNHLGMNLKRLLRQKGSIIVEQ